MNVKEEFIKWFIDNANGRYGNIKEYTVRDDIEESLRNLDRNIFEVDESNYKELIKYLRQELYRKDGAFYKYSAEVQHHRPRAILGKENFLKFLDEKFGSPSYNKSKTRDQKYWLYSPGKQAQYWEEFYRERIMAIGWDRLGDLEKYSTKEEVIEKLQEFQNPDSSKKNDATACDDFQNKIKKGDVIIVKKGKRALLGYGVVTSDYFYDAQRPYFQKCRKVDWKQKGIWNTEFDIVTKTLTDITPYQTEDPNYNTYYERLLGIMAGDKSAARSDYSENLNQILYGPPGTGKTYYSKELAVRLANPLFSVKDLPAEEIREKINEEYQRLYDLGQIVFTTFHQSFSYEDFVEGIKPLPPENEEGNIIYKVQAGIFKEFCMKARIPNQQNFDAAYDSLVKALGLNEKVEELETPTGRKFGISLNSQNNLNLHTGREMKKQGTLTKENIQKEVGEEKKNPYWQGYFQGVINHLKEDYNFKNSRTVVAEKYVLIIDEINRGNVSSIFGELITLLEPDKRIGGKEEIKVKLPYSKEDFGIPSNLHVIGTMNTADRSVEALDTALRRRFTFQEIMPLSHLLSSISFSGFNLREVLETINRRIEALLDRDHCIGHSYFIKISSGDTTALEQTFQNKIIPLLQEYFYHGYEKIALILGEGFIERKEEKVQFATFSQLDDPEIIPSYELKNKIEDIEAAVRKLLNRKDDAAQ